MDKELYQYMLCLPCLSDIPPGVLAETPPGKVSWMNDNSEHSHFSSDSEGSVVDQPSNSSNNLKTEGGHLHFSNKMASGDFSSLFTSMYSPGSAS